MSRGGLVLFDCGADLAGVLLLTFKVYSLSIIFMMINSSAVRVHRRSKFV